VPKSVCPGRAAHSDAGSSDALHDCAHADDAHGAAAGRGAPGAGAVRGRGGARGARARSERSSGGRCWHARAAGQCAVCSLCGCSILAQVVKLHVACSNACNGMKSQPCSIHHAADHPHTRAPRRHTLPAMPGSQRAARANADITRRTSSAPAARPNSIHGLCTPTYPWRHTASVAHPYRALIMRLHRCSLSGKPKHTCGARHVPSTPKIDVPCKSDRQTNLKGRYTSARHNQVHKCSTPLNPIINTHTSQG